jgi:hypothetical protein
MILTSIIISIILTSIIIYDYKKPSNDYDKSVKRNEKRKVAFYNNRCSRREQKTKK